jgi:hypothetical protein
MNRSMLAVRLFAMMALFAVATPAAFSFDVPGPKPKKEKKKKDEPAADTADSKPADNSKPADTQKPADAAPKSDDTAAQKPAAQEAPPAKPVVVQDMEFKFPKSIWESSGASAMKVGDWVESEMAMIPGSKSRQEVVEVGDHYTVVLTKSTMMGQQSEQKMKTIYSEPDPDPKLVEKQREEQKIEVKDFDDKISIKGKEVSAKRHEVYANGKLVSKSWVSKEVPLGGMVKTEGADGKAITAITDFGNGK